MNPSFQEKEKWAKWEASPDSIFFKKWAPMKLAVGAKPARQLLVNIGTLLYRPASVRLRPSYVAVVRRTYNRTVPWSINYISMLSPACYSLGISDVRLQSFRAIVVIFVIFQQRVRVWVAVLITDVDRTIDKSASKKVRSRSRGRRKTAWTSNITSWTGLSVEQLLRAVEDRYQWRLSAHDAANLRAHEDGWRQDKTRRK